MSASKAIILGLVASSVIFLGGVRVTQAAFGVSPPFFSADHLIPGVTYSQTIYLVQDESSENLPIQATLNVPDRVKSWFTIDKGLTFTIPQGVKQFPVTITVSVPKGEPLGVYSGSLIFASAPSPTGQVTIALGADVTISLTVGNGIFEQYSIPFADFPSIEEGWNPRVFFRFQNNGNVSEQLDTAIFSLYDQFDTVRLAYITKQGGFDPVPPFSSKEFTVEFPTDFHIGVGDYWASVTFYKGTQAVATFKDVMHVLPPGSLSSPWQEFLTTLRNYWFYVVLGLVIVLLIIYRVWVVIARRKRRIA